MTKTAKVIAFSQTKGGTGKTTLCCSVAATLAKRGFKTLVLDADEKKPGAVRWMSAAPDSKPFPADVVSLGPAYKKAGSEAKRYIDKYDYVFIDCPGAADSPAHASAMKAADLVVVPVTLSGFDITAAAAMMPIIESVEEDNPKLKKLLVANQATMRSRLAKETMEDVLPHIGLPLATSFYGFRDAFKEAQNEGLALQDLGRAAAIAAKEVDSLTDEILQILEGDK